MIKSGDIVFVRTGVTVGKSFLIDKWPYESVYASFLIRIRLVEGIRPQYIYNFFNSPCYWEQITSKAVGVGQPHCNGSSSSNLLIPIPPIDIQDKISNLIFKLFKYIDERTKCALHTHRNFRSLWATYTLPRASSLHVALFYSIGLGCQKVILEIFFGILHNSERICSIIQS